MVVGDDGCRGNILRCCRAQRQPGLLLLLLLLYEAGGLGRAVVRLKRVVGGLGRTAAGGSGGRIRWRV